MYELVDYIEFNDKRKVSNVMPRIFALGTRSISA